MLFPVFLFVCIFLVYLGFYQYNRCIVQQSLHYTMVRGKELSHASEEEYESLLKDLLADILEKQYLIAISGEVLCETKYETTELTYIGEMLVPWVGIMDNKLETEWEMYVNDKEKRWNPVDFLRICNRLEGE